MADVAFRVWRTDDLTFLWEMLFESLHVRQGDPPFPRSVLDAPDIAHYLTDFGGRPGDDAQLCVDAAGNPIGAAWLRRWTSDDPGYGYVDDEIPEVGMAVMTAWRGRGIGRRLLEDLIARHPMMSLSVDDQNARASTLYRSIGFVRVESAGGSTTMCLDRTVTSAAEQGRGALGGECHDEHDHGDERHRGAGGSAMVVAHEQADDGAEGAQ